MPTLLIWSPLATATVVELGASTLLSWRLVVLFESMKLWVEPESNKARKSWPLIDSCTCIVWLVVMHVTACRETSMSEGCCGVYCSVTDRALQSWNFRAMAIAVSKSGGCWSWISISRWLPILQCIAWLVERWIGLLLVVHDLSVNCLNKLGPRWFAHLLFRPDKPCESFPM